MEKLSNDENSTVRFNTIKRFETELKWIKLLQSASPFDFNDNISKIPDFGVFSLLEFQKCKSRSHGKRQKGNDKRKRCAAQNSNTSFMTYQQSKGNKADMQCFHFLAPYLFQSYANWIKRLTGLTIEVTKCMKLHF